MKVTGKITKVLEKKTGTSNDGKEWQGKYFTSLHPWMIKKVKVEEMETVFETVNHDEITDVDTDLQF